MDKTKETSNMQDIVSLVRAVRSGDEAAFTGLYDRTKSIALRVIRRYCDTPSDYEDILQETYIRVFRSIAELKNEETGRVYSYSTTWLSTQSYEEGISINTLCWTSYDFGYALRVAFEGVAGVSYWESLGFTAYDLKYSEDNYLL